MLHQRKMNGHRRNVATTAVVEVGRRGVLLHISAGLVGGDLENGEHFEIETSLINNFI